MSENVKPVLLHRFSTPLHPCHRSPLLSLPLFVHRLTITQTKVWLIIKRERGRGGGRSTTVSSTTVWSLWDGNNDTELLNLEKRRRDQDPYVGGKQEPKRGILFYNFLNLRIRHVPFTLISRNQNIHRKPSGTSDVKMNLTHLGSFWKETLSSGNFYEIKR